MKWTRIENDNSCVTKVKNHTAVLYNKLVYIYAGFDGSKHKNTLNVLDPTAHAICPISTSGYLPFGRNGHTATLHKSDLYIIGGWNSSIPTTTKEINVLHLDTMLWEKINPLGEVMVSCNMHTSNLYQDKIYVFRGGDGTNYLNDLHYYDIINNTWNSVRDKGIPPTPRANHASCIHEDHLYIFGGWNGVDRLNDLICLSFKTMEWRKVFANGEIPRPRAGMSLNSIRSGILMFGGSGVSSTTYDDLYLFDLQNNCWNRCNTPEQLPTPRAGHTLTAISNRELLLFGGSSGSQYSNNYYILDTSPPPIIEIATKIPEFTFRDLCNNQQFSDVQFLIEGRTVYAHKIIITRLSEHLKTMFSSVMRESRENIIEFKGIRYSVFMILLKYLYTGEVEIDAGTEGQEISTEFIIELLQGADRFLLDPISHECEKILIERITPENAALVLSLFENNGTPSLKKYCNWVLNNECNS